MILRGIVSEIIDRKARITFPDNDDLVSAVLPMAEHISQYISVGDIVIVGMWNQTEGAVLARMSG